MYRVDVYRGKGGKLLSFFFQIEDYWTYDGKLILTRSIGENKENITLKFDEFSAVNIISDDYHLVHYEGSYKGV